MPYVNFLSAGRVFENNKFNITKSYLIELLRIATKRQLFQLEGDPYQQVNGVAIVSPLGPLMANTFVCNIEKQLETKNKVSEVYKRCIDDTLSVMNDVETTSEFLTTLNNSHPSIDFTIELEENCTLPFQRMEVIKNGCPLNTKVYKKNRRAEGYGYMYTTTASWKQDKNAHY